MSGSFQQVPVNFQAWAPPVPMPQTSPPDATSGGLGPSFSIFHPVWQNVVLASWIPPDPLPTVPILLRRVTPGAVPTPPIPKPPAGNSAYPPRNITQFGATPVYVVAPTVTGGITPKTATANTVVTGNVPVVAIVGPVNGGYIINGNAANQGVSAESINVDMTGPCLAGDGNAFGTTQAVQTSTTFTLPGPLAPGVQVWVNAATSGHRFSVIVW